MVELTRTSAVSSSDKILKDVSDMESSDTEGFRNPTRSINNLQKRSYGETEAALK
jgi:hypothetical protein